MARVRPSVLVDELAGKAGSVVFVNSRVGTLIRPRTKPSSPNSAAQLQIRKNLSYVAGVFRSLTTTKLDQWRNYAQTQSHVQPDTLKTYTPSAINVFTALATKVLQSGGTVDGNFSPPATPYLGDALTLAATPGTGKITFTPSGGTTSGSTKVEILLQPLPSPNRKANVKHMTTKAFFTFPGGVMARELNVPVGYYGVAYRFVNTTTGQMTEPVLLPNVTVSVALMANDTKDSKAKNAA